jgi:hypothetical protein
MFDTWFEVVMLVLQAGLIISAAIAVGVVIEALAAIAKERGK